ncbi:hypothetical protein ACXEO8_20195 [Cytobacillus firmus]
MDKKIPATDFNKLQKDFHKIILSIDNTVSSRYKREAKIKFHDSDFILTVDEVLDTDLKIKLYHYDLIGKDHNRNDQIVFGFHCQSHKRDERYKTDSDPFHIHLSKLIEFTTMDRLDNFQLQELPRVIELIGILIHFEKHILKREETRPKKKKSKR